MTHLKKVFWSPTQQTKARAALALAKVRLDHGTSSYVCNALKKVGGDHYLELHTTTERLRKEIQRRIWPHGFVDQWLRSEHRIDCGHWQQHDNDALREYRIRWIDNMIKELT